MRREHDALGALESLRALENLRAEQIATLENRQTMEWLLSARGEATHRWWIAALDYAIEELHKLAGDEKGGDDPQWDWDHPLTLRPDSEKGGTAG